MISPRREQTRVLGWRIEAGVVLFNGCVDVLERRRGGCRWSNGEAQTVGLIVVEIRVLTEDYSLDVVQWAVSGPVARTF